MFIIVLLLIYVGLQRRHQIVRLWVGAGRRRGEARFNILTYFIFQVKKSRNVKS